MNPERVVFSVSAALVPPLITLVRARRQKIINRRSRVFLPASSYDAAYAAIDFSVSSQAKHNINVNFCPAIYGNNNTPTTTRGGMVRSGSFDGRRVGECLSNEAVLRQITASTLPRLAASLIISSLYTYAARQGVLAS